MLGKTNTCEKNTKTAFPRIRRHKANFGISPPDFGHVFDKWPKSQQEKDTDSACFSWSLKLEFIRQGVLTCFSLSKDISILVAQLPTQGISPEIEKMINNTFSEFGL